MERKKIAGESQGKYEIRHRCAMNLWHQDSKSSSLDQISKESASFTFGLLYLMNGGLIVRLPKEDKFFFKTSSKDKGNCFLPWGVGE